MKWNIIRKGRAIGPLTPDQVHAMGMSGKLGPDDILRPHVEVDDMKWYIVRKGQTTGPFVPSQLIKMASSDDLRPDDIVQPHGGNKQYRAEQLEGLFCLPEYLRYTPDNPPPRGTECAVRIETGDQPSPYGSFLPSGGFIGGACRIVRAFLGLNPRPSEAPPGPAAHAQAKGSHSGHGGQRSQRSVGSGATQSLPGASNKIAAPRGETRIVVKSWWNGQLQFNDVMGEYEWSEPSYNSQWNYYLWWSKEPQTLEELIATHGARIASEVGGYIVPAIPRYVWAFSLLDIPFTSRTQRFSHMPLLYNEGGGWGLTRCFWQQVDCKRPSDWFIKNDHGLWQGQDYMLACQAPDVLNHVFNQATGELLVIRNINLCHRHRDITLTAIRVDNGGDREMLDELLTAYRSTLQH